MYSVLISALKPGLINGALGFDVFLMELSLFAY